MPVVDEKMLRTGKENWNFFRGYDLVWCSSIIPERKPSECTIPMHFDGFLSAFHICGNFWSIVSVEMSTFRQFHLRIDGGVEYILHFKRWWSPLLLLSSNIFFLCNLKCWIFIFCNRLNIFGIHFVLEREHFRSFFYKNVFFNAILRPQHVFAMTIGIFTTYFICHFVKFHRFTFF